VENAQAQSKKLSMNDIRHSRVNALLAAASALAPKSSVKASKGLLSKTGAKLSGKSLLERGAEFIFA